MQGFTLMELLVSITILGVVASIGVPIYLGYTDTANTALVQNNLRTIYLQQQDYLVENSVYYKSGDACTQSVVDINANLFGGKQVLTIDDGFTYCVLQITSTDFTARAEEIGGDARIFTIDHNNVVNF